jgi:hypothetical protein
MFDAKNALAQPNHAPRRFVISGVTDRIAPDRSSVLEQLFCFFPDFR